MLINFDSLIIDLKSINQHMHESDSLQLCTVKINLIHFYSKLRSTQFENCFDFNSSSAAMQLDKIRLMNNGTEY